MEYLIGIIAVVVILVAIHGWFSGKSHKPIEDTYNRELKANLVLEKEDFNRRMAIKTEELNKQIAMERRALDEKSARISSELTSRQEHISTLRREFDSGFIRGRRWLAQFVAEVDRSLDESIAGSLRSKSHPALKASEEVAIARAERRRYKEQLKFLEYQLESYKQYFPFLAEYEEIILDEAIPLSQDGANKETIENADPVLLYVPKSEFDRLSTAARNQLALDRYLNRSMSRAAIGRFYERFLGYKYEREGWKVEYQGIVKGYDDLGRDLICRRGNQVQIVQAKCWATDKLIHEKHIFQLFGTTQLFLMNLQQEYLLPANVSAVFITTTSLSSEARRVADWLKIQVEERTPIDKSYPMIKCNINQTSKEKIYHLPFDQQYDRTRIIPELGELYVQTVAEAERRGFRRAFRHSAWKL